jgi:hypothetical protein
MTYRPDLDPALYLPGDHVKARPIWTKRHGKVRCVELARFAHGRRVERVEYGRNRLPRHETVRRALLCVDAEGYNLITANCEHLAVELVTGRPFSHQVANAAATGAGTGGSVAAAKGGLVAVAAAGPVAGYSAAGLTSGLSGVGFGSMAFGVTTVALLPTAAVVAATQKLWRDDPHHPDQERHARRSARRATVAGAVGGAIATRGAIQALGTAAGAARLTSGLRVLGGLFGGGMKAGTVVAALGPAAVGVAVGWFVYRIVRGRS